MKDFGSLLAIYMHLNWVNCIQIGIEMNPWLAWGLLTSLGWPLLTCLVSRRRGNGSWRGGGERGSPGHCSSCSSPWDRWGGWWHPVCLPVLVESLLLTSDDCTLPPSLLFAVLTHSKNCVN